MKQGIPLHTALGEVAHACNSVLLSPEGNQSTQLHMQETAREKCAFLVGSWDGFPGDLHNFWAEKLTATQICANSRLRALLGKFLQILLEVLTGKIAQSWSLAGCQRGLQYFLREGWFPSRNVQFSRGSCLACS